MVDKSNKINGEPERRCLVLVQHRTASEYNDFIGKFYHFPKKYLNLLSTSGEEFVYYEPTTKKGANVYFGYGRLGKVFEDKKEPNHFFVEVIDYKTLAEEVAFNDSAGKPREGEPYFNPQNAVRRIAPEALDGICLDGGIRLNFTADAHLIKVLGEELIATEVVGILELVKNSYDAGATTCSIRIENIPNLQPHNKYSFNDLEGPVVIIDDNGEGMDRHVIENGWLRPASTIKTNIKDRLKKEKLKAISDSSLGTYNSLVKELKKYHKGRLPLGEKGVGRFATHRLGSKLIITTKPANIDYEYKLIIDWDKFDSFHVDGPVDLDSIGVHLSRQVPSRDYGDNNSGTRLVIYGGREGYTFTESIIRDINRSILKLCSPRNAPKKFKARFECPQLTDLDETPIDKEFAPVFSLDALVDNNGKAELDIEFIPPSNVPMPREFIEKNKTVDLRKKDENDPNYWSSGDKNNNFRSPQCGSFFLHIDVWYRRKPWIDGPNMTNFTEHLDNYGGISIYRDGLNIFPAEWGAEIDWLRLSKRHIKKGVNISYYNMIGNLEVEQSNNLELIDKTDRQGMLNNQALRDLSTLVRNIILEFEVHFTGKRNQYSELTSNLIREPKVLGQVTRQGSELVQRIADRYDLITDSSMILEGFGDPNRRRERLVNLSTSLKNVEKSIKAIQNVQDMMVEQAGFGLAMGVAVHEIAKITSNFYNGITQALKSDMLDREKLEDLKNASSSLKTELKRLGPFRAIRNEPLSVFKINKSLNFCRSVFKRKFHKLSITFNYNDNESFEVYARYGVVNQILSNLLENSRYWLSNIDGDRMVQVNIENAHRRLIIADSGPDIDNSIRPYLFEPGYSLKVPPSGLGLYICKYYMRSIGGNIYEAGSKDRITGLNGAQFVLDFSRVKSKETS